METPLEFGGNVLHVAPWVPPTKNHKSVLFLRNVPSHKDAVIALFKMFSEFGVVSNVCEWSTTFEAH